MKCKADDVVIISESEPEDSGQPRAAAHKPPRKIMWHMTDATSVDVPEVAVSQVSTLFTPSFLTYEKLHFPPIFTPSSFPFYLQTIASYEKLHFPPIFTPSFLPLHTKASFPSYFTLLPYPTNNSFYKKFVASYEKLHFPPIFTPSLLLLLPMNNSSQ
jgi:hypothetical protein